MRLRKFEIKNYKAIASVSFDWEDLVVLIGENNCGKSSVLSALAAFLSGSAIKDVSLFRRHQAGPDDAIELTGYFDQLTDADTQQVAVRGRTHNSEWILKKKYWLELNDDDDSERGGWKEQLFSFSSTETFTGWPNPDTTWNAFPADYQPLKDLIPNCPARPNAASKSALRELLKERRPDLVALGPPAWTPNPGGGGNWKSNANSILPRAIFVRAVHEASDETIAKDASTYGKLINLIVERQLAQRPEMAALKTALDAVLQLFRPDDQHPEHQAEEIRALQNRINEGLSEVIGGQAFIRTEPPELRSLVMPSTSLVIKDPLAAIETHIAHQGHGLQRTLVMTLLQILAEAQEQPNPASTTAITRSTILIIEEPELYLHPQMERLMRDVLYRLASQAHMQIACCTHSPVFLDIADRYKSIVRMLKQANGNSIAMQVSQDLFPLPTDHAEKIKLQTVARFHPTVNELFFAKHVILLEEFSAIAAFERAAELTGIYRRNQRIRREVSLIDCDGKMNIPAFQRILNAFGIPYRVLHDLDTSNPTAFAWNARIQAAIPAGPTEIRIHAVGPEDLESLLGVTTTKGNSKPYSAVKTVEELYANNNIPASFIAALNMVYFGTTTEPVAA